MNRYQYHNHQKLNVRLDRVSRTTFCSLRRGVTVTELLIALAISATLLVAAMGAIDGSLRAYSINTVQADLSQKSRVALHRLTSDIRSSRAHSPVATSAVSSFTQGLIATDSAIVFFDADDREVTYALDTSSQELRVTINGNTPIVLLRGVTQFTVKMTPTQSATARRTAGAFDLLARADITLTVKRDLNDNDKDLKESAARQSLKLTTAVSPKQNVW